MFFFSRASHKTFDQRRNEVNLVGGITYDNKYTYKANQNEREIAMKNVDYSECYLSRL